MTSLQAPESKGRVFDALAAFLIASAWITFICMALDWGKPFEHDRDEGVNLIKAQLMSRGHKLYRDIWSDQPPLFSHILEAWNRCGLGRNAVESGRILAALFGGVTLGAFYLVMRKHTKTLAALAGVVCLAWSNDFLRLSHSVMIGLPSLAFAICAWALLPRHKRSIPLFCLAGILFGLAVMTKLSALLFLPFILWSLPEGNRRASPWFMVSAALAVGIIGFVSGSFSSDQLTASHFSASSAHPDLRKSAQFVARFFRDDGELFLLGGLIVLVPWAQRPRRISWLLPLVWTFTGAAVLCLHSPVWYHHRLLITPALAWWAAVGVNTFLKTISSLPGFHRTACARVGLCIMLLASARCFYKVPRALEAATSDRCPEGPAILAKLQAVNAHSFYSSHAIFTVYGGWETPPELAVMTSKRISSGVASEDWVLERLLVHKPDQLLLSAKKGKSIPRNLQAQYSAIGQEHGFAHLVLNPMPLKAP